MGGLFLSCSGDQGGCKKGSRGGEFSLKTTGCTMYCTPLTFILDCSLQTIFHLYIPKKDLAGLHFLTKYFQNRIIMFCLLEFVISFANVYICDLGLRFG